MKKINILTVAIAAAVLILPAFDGVYARGGGGHFSGGGRGGGGWSGGRGGGGFERGGGGEFRGGGERPGEHGSGEYHGGGQGGHGRHNNNNNNNNNNTNNYYEGGGWGWGWGAADDALAGMAIGAAIGAASQPSTIIVENQAPADSSQQQTSPNGMPQIGTQVTTIPPGAVSKNVNGIMAYECRGAWYRPYFGSNGVYYIVVSPPPTEGSASVDQSQQGD